MRLVRAVERRFGENGSLGAEDSRHLDAGDGSYGLATGEEQEELQEQPGVLRDLARLNRLGELR